LGTLSIIAQVSAISDILYIMRIIRKVLLVLTLTAVLCIFASCSSKADSEAILKRADHFAKSVSLLDSDRLFKCVCESDYQAAKSVSDRMDISDLDDDKKLVMRVIAGSIGYEVDKDSLVIGDDNESAEVDIEFTIVDYKAVIADKKLRLAKQMAREIGDAKIKTGYVVRCYLVCEDEQWYVTADTLDGLSELYSFLDDDIQIGFTSEDISAAIEKKWWMTDPVNGALTNVSYLELYYDFNRDEGSNISGSGFKYYYTVTYNGKELFRSPSSVIYGRFSCYFDESNGAAMDDGYLAEGNYEFRVFGASDDRLIDTETVRVNRNKPKPTPVQRKDIIVPAGTEGFMIDVDGVSLRVNTDMEDYLSDFAEKGIKYDVIKDDPAGTDTGSPQPQSGDDSGLFSTQIDLAGSPGNSYFFKQSTVYVHTSVVEGREIITFMSLNGSGSTPEGISIGSTRQEVESAYGYPAGDEGFMSTFNKADTRLTVVYAYDGTVDLIQYTSPYFPGPV